MTDSPLTWRDNTPVSNQFDDVYFSIANGLSESRYVFLTQNNLSQRWQQLDNDSFCILETGFGTGLNFLASWQLWNQCKPNKSHLHFVSIEKYPLNTQDIKKALAHWPELQDLASQLYTQLPPNIAGWHTLYFDQITLTLIYDDVATALTQIKDSSVRANAVFLDGFSPAKNPDMWTDSILKNISECCAQKATLTTFTAVGRIRRSLQTYGFTVKKCKGHGKKRDMLSAYLDQETAKPRPYWYKNATDTSIKTVAVIGAGIAGCHIAYRLAEKGIKVTVFEQEKEAAVHASGNPQAVLFIKLSTSNGMLAKFSLRSFLHAQRFYRQLQNKGILSNTDIQLCGMLQLYEKDTWIKLKQHYKTQQHWLKFVDPKEASTIAGSQIEHHAIWFRDSGWIAPKKLCKALLQHPNINCKYNVKINKLSFNKNKWQLDSATDKYNTDSIILSNAMDAQALLDDYQLPFKTAPGQITLFKQEPAHASLQCVVCKDGYIAPPLNNTVSIGASFRMKSPETGILNKDHQFNIDNYMNALPNMPKPTEVNGRVAVRTATTDYLPLAGPIPNTHKFCQRFKALGLNAKKDINEYGKYYKNLYLLAGLGSRGLSYAPLCSDLICEQLTTSSESIEPEISQALNPARFLIRGLKRGTANDLLL